MRARNESAANYNDALAYRSFILDSNVYIIV